MIIIGGIFMIKMESFLLPISMIPVVISTIIVYIMKAPFKKLIKDQAVLEAEKNASM